MCTRSWPSKADFGLCTQSPLNMTVLEYAVRAPTFVIPDPDRGSINRGLCAASLVEKCKWDRCAHLDTRSWPSMTGIWYVYSVAAEYDGDLVCVLGRGRVRRTLVCVLSRRSLAQCAWHPLRGGSCDFSLPENNIPAW